MLKNGAEIILECLLEQEITTIFGYPGGAILNIYDALYKYSDKIKHILTAHEQGATHAADGYARSTGKPGVVLTTSGPGATNTVTGIATAYMDSIPMIVITGNVATNNIGLDSFQEINITGITMPITKHNFLVRDISELADTIRKAFKIATSGRKGPVLIDIPKDITSATYEHIPKANQQKNQEKTIFPHQNIREAVELINNSKRPFIYTGGGCNISNNANIEINKLAKKLNAPVSSSLMGQGSFDNFDDQYIGMLGLHGTKTASTTLMNCDLFIAIGTRLSDRVVLNTKKFASNAKIIQIDIDESEINKNIKVDCSIIGDVKSVVHEINDNIAQKQNTTWMKQIQHWRNEYQLDQLPINENDITPKQFIETLCNLTEGNAIISTEVGQHQVWTAEYYKFKYPKQFLTSGGLGTMGFGLGCAIGAKIANSNKTVINIAGDGSFYMNCNELITLKRYNIPIIEIIFNNQVLGMVRQWQRLIYDKRFSQTTLGNNVNFAKLAEAYDIMFYKISTPTDIEYILKKALKNNSPAIIEVPINKDMNVLPMAHAKRDINDPIMTIDID